VHSKADIVSSVYHNQKNNQKKLKTKKRSISEVPETVRKPWSHS